MGTEEKIIPDCYIAIDLETTGLDAKKDQIIEIGVVRMEYGRETAVFSRLVRPNCEIGERVQQLTKITNEMVQTAPYIEEILPDLVAFESESVVSSKLPLVGHNVLFDYSFLKRAMINCGYAYERTGIDTLKLARKFCNQLEHKNLDAVCAFLEIPMEQHHRAVNDARAAANILEKLKQIYWNQDPEAFLPKPLIYQVKRAQLLTKHQKEYLNDLIKCNRIKHTVDIERLTRAEASRLTDQWIQKYGKLAPEQKSWRKEKEGEIHV
ncbi:DNA polymerase III PolC-type [Clostridiales bacterium CHKCI001]|nr:DNA polymerase III PolC-type [Clostridiales bacterium CHKCI001]